MSGLRTQIPLSDTTYAEAAVEPWPAGLCWLIVVGTTLALWTLILAPFLR